MLKKIVEKTFNETEKPANKQILSTMALEVEKKTDHEI